MRDYVDLSACKNLSERDVEAVRLIAIELDRARGKFGPFASAHEGFSVLHEEVDELWDEVKSKRKSRGNLATEATQVGAMAARFLVDVVAKMNPTSDDFLDAMGDADRAVERRFYGGDAA